MNWEDMDIEDVQAELLRMKYVLNHYTIDLSMLAEVFNYEFEDIDKKAEDILDHINNIWKILNEKIEQ